MEKASCGAMERSPGFPFSSLCTMTDQGRPGLVFLPFPGTQSNVKQVWLRPEWQLVFARFSSNSGRSSWWTHGNSISFFHTLPSGVPPSLLLWWWVIVYPAEDPFGRQRISVLG